MTIHVTAAGSAVIMRLEGRMDEQSCKAFDEACAQVLADGAVNLIADFSALSYISSAGVGSLVRAVKTFRQAGGDIFLTGLHGLVRDVFELTRVITVFRVFESPELALTTA